MDRLEWLIVQIKLWTISLLVFFFVLFLIKFKKSRNIFTIFGFLADKKRQKDKIENQKRFKAKIYVRDSSEKTSALLYILLFLVIAFIVTNQYVNFVVVTSESMAPTIHRGDLVLVQSISKTPSIGDIIQFEVQNRRMPVLHRVAEVSAIGYKTKGDFNPSPDNWILKDSQIQAKAITLFNIPVIIPEIGEIFIVESKITKFGSEYGFVSGLVNIFKILSFIIFLLAFLSLLETLFRRGNTS
ncbi:MAG: signal peptidase I [ANME-2 cluster archaeon]|nr:MAG: signal peptidase I [ANME-2 cluster archaeon]